MLALRRGGRRLFCWTPWCAEFVGASCYALTLNVPVVVVVVVGWEE